MIIPTVGGVYVQRSVGDEVPAGLVVTLTGGAGVSGVGHRPGRRGVEHDHDPPRRGDRDGTAKVADWYGLTATATGGY